jgi:hypothetical protein
MNKKNFILVGLTLVLAVVYVICFTDWFRPKTIDISSTTRSFRATTLLIFSLHDDYELTEVKVVSLAALQTNKLAQPVWHLVSDSGSDDVDHFLYGENIKGMDPAVAGARPEPLQPGVMYRIFVTDGKVKGRFDFQLGSPSANTATNR